MDTERMLNMAKITLLESYNQHVVRRGDDECWGWNGSKDKRQYGWIYINDDSVGAHRASYELHNGPFDTSLFVLHRCDNPECTNPKHLFLGTQRDNMEDMTKKGRRIRGSKVPCAKLREGDVVRIRELAQQGVSNVNLGQVYNMNWRSIYKVVHGFTWAHIPGALKTDSKRLRPRGQDNSQAKLTAQQVREIRLLNEQGRPRAELAKKYKVSVSAIGRIIQRVVWAHLD